MTDSTAYGPIPAQAGTQRHHGNTLPAVAVDPATPISALSVLGEVAAERVLQLAKGYTPEHDDALSFGQLWTRIDARVQAGNAGPWADRRLAIEAAALAVALIESIDRRRARLIAERAETQS